MADYDAGVGSVAAKEKTLFLRVGKLGCLRIERSGMKPSSIRFMDVAKENPSTQVPRLTPEDDRVVRERCDMSSFDPLDPRDKPAPAEQVFKRQSGKEADASRDRGLTEAESGHTLEEGEPVVERLHSEGEATLGGTSAGAEGASLKMSLQSQIDIFDMLRSGKPNVMHAALQILQNNFRWNGVLRLDTAESDVVPPGAGRMTAEIVDNSFDGKTSKGRVTHHLTLDASSQSSRLTQQFRQAALWLSSIVSMARQMEHLRKLADTDELSGAYNRRYFLQTVPEIIERARRKRFCVSLLLFDIDDFKHYNDNYGHAAGDAIIREVIHLLRRCTRSNDLVARIGGDEFAVVFGDDASQRQPDSQHPRTVFAMAQRFRKAVAEHPWNTQGGPIAGRLSISGGLATFPWDAQNINDLMAVADAELMKAKSMGKNAIVLANPDTDQT
jgi:diguanylate cyclase (GGDEF)-like protein